jgi:hypothetical protein
MTTTDSGIFCPACKMKNDAGAVRCIYCNTPLGKPEAQKTVMLRNLHEVTGALTEEDYEDILSAPAPATERFMDFELPSKGIVLINLDNGQPITMQDAKAFILGRFSSEIQTREPLVDLTELDALELGVSRVHVMIRKSKKGYEIIDMDSSNGTWLENQRLSPQRPYQLDSGDRIRIGRLNMLAFFPKVSKA